MINESTVFILGAGASCPYGFPSGEQLREEICKIFFPQYSEFLSKRKIPREEEIGYLDTAKLFTETFCNSSTKSIDLFLSRNPNFKKIGKESIIFRILEAERNSKFREEINDRKQDWYTFIFNRMTDDISKKEDYIKFSKNDVIFITFNYDRSLEYFLFDSFNNSFSEIPQEEKIKEFSKIKFYHVYGQITKLDWQDSNNGILYRTNINDVGPTRFIDNLKIINEERTNPELKDIIQTITEAQKIFFLGFSYAKENLEILKLPGILHANQKLHGTALGFSKKELYLITQFFGQQFNKASIRPMDVHIENMDSLSLLREYL